MRVPPLVLLAGARRAARGGAAGGHVAGVGRRLRGRGVVPAGPQGAVPARRAAAALREVKLVQGGSLSLRLC